jgi:hypothetical protein
MTFEEKMRFAMWAYKTGNPILVTDKNCRVIHGEVLLSEGVPIHCFVIPVDAAEWSAGTWPQILDGARQGWLKNKSIA